MIQIVINDSQAENLFADYLQSKIDKFSKDLNIEASLARVKDTKHKVDIWLGIEKEELDKLKSKEQSLEYLKKKQHYAEELKKRAMIHHDRFESYEIVIDLLACYLANKPVKDTTSIPTIKDIDGFIDGVTPNLEKWDLVAFRELKEFVLKMVGEEKIEQGQQAIREGYKKVLGKV